MSDKPYQFQPGNPGGPGRPVGSRSVETLFRDAIEKLAKDNPEIIDYERELVTSIFMKAKGGDMKAMEMYLDRLYGKPKQSIDTKHSGSIALEDLSGLNSKQLEEERKKLL